MPAGTIFANTSTGQGFDHTKSTWATQVVLAVGFTLGK
jgi:hypothetical protein